MCTYTDTYTIIIFPMQFWLAERLSDLKLKFVDCNCGIEFGYCCSTTRTEGPGLRDKVLP